jgi:hypothetical protein
VPAELREVLRANQRDGYAALMKVTAEAIIELARDRRYVGGTVGVMAVLHTWTRQLVYHPHVHCVVTGGGVSDDGRDWHPARSNFLVPRQPLAVLVRAKMRAALAERRPDLILPTWRKPWVTHCTAWGDGAEAVLGYLARYVFRVAITESRIVGLDDDGVTIRHKHRASGSWHTTRLNGHEFMRRFLQHVLPKGLHKVRYSGLWHHSRRDHAARARQQLALDHARRRAETGGCRPGRDSKRLFYRAAAPTAAPLPVLQGSHLPMCACSTQPRPQQHLSHPGRRRTCAEDSTPPIRQTPKCIGSEPRYWSHNFPADSLSSTFPAIPPRDAACSPRNRSAAQNILRT